MPACPCLFACALAGAMLGGQAPAAIGQAPAQTGQPPTQTGSARDIASASSAQTYPHDRHTPLAAHVAALLSAPEMAAAHWGIAVTALDGTPVFGWNEGQLFRPASTAKLFTLAAALALLGPDHTVSTRITGDLDQGSGTVTGDLSLIGGGDPAFGTADLPFRETPEDPAPPDPLGVLADRLMALGIRHIRGDIVGNDTLFAQEPPPEGWAAEDLVWGYGALPSALSIDDNQLRLLVTAPPVKGRAIPGGVDPPAPSAAVTVQQRVPWVQLSGDVAVLPPEAPEGRHIGVAAGALRTLRVFGTIPIGARPATEEIALSDPAAYAAAALKGLLLARGVEVDGDPRAVHTPSEEARPYLQVWRAGADDAPNNADGAEPNDTACPPAHPVAATLVTLPSAPLRDEVLFTLKTSANLHAEVLLRQLARKDACPGAPAVEGAEGAARVRRWLLRVGLPEHDFYLYDGSGLSTKDLVTPRAETQLLAYAAAQPWSAAWKDALPVGGVDGTLANRFTTPLLRGRVTAKTGTLGESRALAGYLRCLSGRVVIFSILVDNHEPGSAADRTAMDALVAAIVSTQ